MNKKFGILFVTDFNFVPFAIRSIESFCLYHEDFDIFLGLINVDEKVENSLATNLQIGRNRIFFLNSNSPAGVSTRDWAATRRANFSIEIFKKRPELTGILYFDVDYIFRDEVADQIADEEFDFILRSCVVVERSKATQEQIDNTLELLPGGKIETSIWAGKGNENLDINSGLVWIKNSPTNIEILKEWENLMSQESYAWFSDQNNLRLVIQAGLTSRSVKWKPVDRKLYERFYHEKGPEKNQKLSSLRDKFHLKIYATKDT